MVVKDVKEEGSFYLKRIGIIVVVFFVFFLRRKS